MKYMGDLFVGVVEEGGYLSMKLTTYNIIHTLEELAALHHVIYFRPEDLDTENPDFVPDATLKPTQPNLTKMVQLAAAQKQPIFIECILASDALAEGAVIDSSEEEIQDLMLLLSSEQLPLFEQRIEALNQSFDVEGDQQPVQITVYLFSPHLTLAMTVYSEALQYVAQQLDTTGRARKVAEELLGKPIDDDLIIETIEQIRSGILEKFTAFLLQEPSFASCTNKELRRIDGYLLTQSAEQVWQQLKEQKKKK